MNSKHLYSLLIGLVILLAAVNIVIAVDPLEKINSGVEQLTKTLTTIAASIVALFAVFHGIEFLRSESPDAKEHALKTLTKYAAAAIFIYAGKDIFELFAKLFTNFGN